MHTYIFKRHTRLPALFLSHTNKPPNSHLYAKEKNQPPFQTVGSNTHTQHIQNWHITNTRKKKHQMCHYRKWIQHKHTRSLAHTHTHTNTENHFRGEKIAYRRRFTLQKEFDNTLQHQYCNIDIQYMQTQRSFPDYVISVACAAAAPSIPHYFMRYSNPLYMSMFRESLVRMCWSEPIENDSNRNVTAAAAFDVTILREPHAIDSGCYNWHTYKRGKKTFFFSFWCELFPSLFSIFQRRDYSIHVATAN